MPEITEIKEAVDKLGTTFAEFKAANDERIKQIESKGQADPLLEEKVNKLSEAVADHSEIKERLEKAETALKRAHKGDPGEGGGEEAAVMKEYKTGLDLYFRKGATAGLAELEQKALSAGSDPDGGYSVRPEVSNEIIRNVTESTPMRQIARVRTISARLWEQMKRTAGAVSGGWVGEKAARSETGGPTLGLQTIPAHEQYAEPHATQIILEDSGINIEAWIGEEVVETFVLTENTAFVSGDGVLRPRGILTFTAGTGDGEIEQVNSGSAAAVTGDGLIDLQDALKEPYQPNASWLMRRATVSAVRKLKDSQNQYLWQPGLGKGVPDVLLGNPIVKGADMPAVAANALAIAYGDFRRGYTIVDRAGIRVLRDPLTTKGFVKFYTTKRTGGDVVLCEAIKIQKIAA
jgi:HK97 family phage major capsid protein